ncbi:cell surface protein SprA [Paracrocinitomix mangrovi]|uniref:T9SS outer membrane translocon Sov/SprA n=1 Tax=Paracrocinitomix mangrovi TaxID=2862509 RepID=UPI001C8DF028|nr:cell surface protein SprA [Paracrocinitomix mangrovi]UKN00888.1 cell surface protein SprA [Paracrocinitomix mangrovi]
MKKLLGIFVLTLFCSVAFTQNDSTLHFPLYDHYDYTDKKDSPINLMPSGVNTEVKYNPETGMYEFYQTIGGINYRHPTSMTLEEYLAWKRQQATKELFMEKIKEDNEQQQGKNPIPALKIENEAFDVIFGGDEINIRPQGSAELSFGVNISRYDNPVLPIKQRRVTTFDFQQRINLNLVGQIGDKLKLTIAQNTEATFNFQNQVKIEYTGYEDEIIQKIEAGNVSLPLNTTLIQGSQSLFGIRTDLRWGRLTVNTILAQEKGKRQEINVSGGAQVQDYEVKADNYEANKHYFLNYYHRDHYDSSMQTMPLVQSGVQITKIEVWVTNRVNKVENTRNIIAFSDLGETRPSYVEGNVNQFNSEYPDNDANELYGILAAAPQIRGFSSAVPYLAAYTGQPGPFEQSIHYEKVENARQLSEQEFTYNAQLGYISLKSPLNQDEVLGVAYQYTVNGRTYQVGEFSNDVPVEEGSKSALILRLLKPTIVNPQNITWDLMMKNVYSIGAYQVSQADFIMDLYYNNPQSSVDVNYLPYDGVNDKLLMQQLDLDRLNLQNNGQPDGRFDYVAIQYEGNKATNGGTIDPRTGRVYFTTIEPFGKTLRKKLEASSLAPLQVEGIVFEELYDSTKTAAQQIPSKNRFKIKGEYKSSVSSDISLNTLNVPEGSVTVTAGGVKLVEGVDYTVDYNLGRVKILNEGILESGTPIKVQLESNSLFGFQQKSLVGAHFNYEFNKDFNWGATVMNLTEKPLTQKVNIGDEPISNTVLGTDISYRKEVPFLTKMVDVLPIISTKEKSSINAYGEFAYLIPGTQRAISKEGISYIDGFEGSQSAIDIKTFGTWRLASVPQGQSTLFPEANPSLGLGQGFNRSKLAWYVIDPTTFYQNSSVTPDHIQGNDNILCNSNMHILSQTALFPQFNPVQGTLNNIPVLDLAYYPTERGQYNYDTTSAYIDADGKFTNPEDRWSGVMRALTTTNFETANIQFIQFWLLDPFNDDATQSGTVNTSGGDLYFNLGNISEDILPDSRKSFENGLPASTTFDPDDYDTTEWAVVYNQQVIVNAFDNNPESRVYQDVGLDGLSDAGEAGHFNQFISWVNNSNLSAAAKAQLLDDPSSDNYQYYLDPQHDIDTNDIVRRYKNFNGMDGNSPSSEMSDSITGGAGYTIQATTIPDIEDLNQDNNLSESESYFQYRVSLRPQDLVVGQNFITNSQEVEVCEGSGKIETWYQFKIPIENYETRINGINDFRSIRFIRMFMKEFDHPVVLRFARLELIRGEWRKYLENINEPGESINDDPNATEFNIAAVNLEENEGKEPVGYAIPPGILREQDQGSINLRQLNEQSLSFEVCGLKDGDARAAYKNVNFDIRSYQKLKMFIHGEARNVETDLQDDQLTVFIRLGTDFEQNYYEYEIPLKLTPWGTLGTEANADEIWPDENNAYIIFNELTNLKLERNSSNVPYGQEYIKVRLPDASDPNDPQVITRIKVRGNPNLQGLKTIMIGVRNPGKDTDHPWMYAEDGLDKCAEVWVNELRLTDFDQQGGWASTARVSMQLADFATVNVAGNYSTPNWGSIEKKVSERQRDTQKSFDFSTNVNLGQFFGRKANIRLPFYYGYSAAAIDPQFDLLAPDIRLEDLDPNQKAERLKISRDLTLRKSYNFTNVRRERPSGKEVHIWDPENWTATYSYNELYRRDLNTEYDRTRTWRGNLSYLYSKKPITWEPFKNVKAFRKSPWLRIIRDINVDLGPKSFSFTNDVTRMYNQRQNRNFADTLAPIFDPTVLKNFTWVRGYDLKYDLTKQLKFTFSANNSSIISEPEGIIDRDHSDPLVQERYSQFIRSIQSAFDKRVWNGADSTWSDSLGVGGYNMQYGHSYNITYKLPFNKIPLTDWINANLKLRGSYDWQRAPLAQPQYGNTIQNSRNFSVNGQINFLTLYNHVPYLKKINDANRGGGRGGRGGRNSKKEDPEKEQQKLKKELENDLKNWPEEPDSTFLAKKKMTMKEYKKARKKYFKKKERERKKKKREKREVSTPEKIIGQAIMSVRNLSFTYTENDGMLLPGFAGESSVLGMGAHPNHSNNTWGQPSFMFVAGAQNKDIWGRQTNAWGGSDFASFAASNEWLTKYAALNIQHTVTHTQNINGRLQLEPFKDLSISLTIDRKYNENQNSFYRYNPDSVFNSTLGIWEAGEGHSHFNPVNSGSLNFTTITWKTAFSKLDSLYMDQVFADMRNYRTVVSSQLGQLHGTSLDSGGYYDGFGANQQDVLVGSFLAAYTGRGTGNKFFDIFKAIPLPNWDIRYDGLSKIDFMKKLVRNFTLKHAYRSTVSLTNFQTNLGAIDENGGWVRDASNNFIAKEQITGITITEQFAPFLGLDATWIIGKNGLITSFEFKRDRSLALNVPNMQITEMRGAEWVIGSGYKFSKVKLPFKFMGETVESDLNLRFDLSIRNNITVSRNIIEDTNQPTSGQRMYSVKFRVDYNIGPNLNVAYYFDRVVNTPVLSNAYPTANTSTGISLRFNLAQ